MYSPKKLSKQGMAVIIAKIVITILAIMMVVII